MNKEEEQLQFLGFIGIFKESIKMILSHPKIFTKISLAFILPLTLIGVAHAQFSKFLLDQISKIYLDNTFILNTQAPSPNTNDYSGATSLLSTEWILFWVFNFAYDIFALIFSLLSISTVVYTVACIYTDKEITFKKIASVIPKVWKRLTITLLSYFCIIFAYIFVVVFVFTFVIIIYSIIFIYRSGDFTHMQLHIRILEIVLSIVLFVGKLVMAILWQLANVISVMENIRGFKAMKKSRELIKGKIGTAIALSLGISLCSTPNLFYFFKQLVKSDKINIVEVGPKYWYGIHSLVLSPLIVLYSLVVRTIFYFVCKSYHHENFNKSSLADHLQSLHGGYVPLNIKDDIQIERLIV